MPRHPLTRAFLKCPSPEALVKLFEPDLPKRLARDAVSRFRVPQVQVPEPAPLMLGSESSRLPLI